MRPTGAQERAIVVMGVTGCGKSTIASALARHLGREFRDGDDFHSLGNVAKMSRGQALTDEDRLPWLDSITAWLAETPRGVVACSALTRNYRDRLRRAGPLTMLHLAITPRTSHRRVTGRSGHFMPPTLIDDQYTTLQTPLSDEIDVVQLNGEISPPVLIALALSAITNERR